MTAAEALDQMRRAARVTPGQMTVGMMASVLSWADAIEAEMRAWEEKDEQVIALLKAKDEEITRLKNEIDGHESFQRSVNEALNRGDGSYRP